MNETNICLYRPFLQFLFECILIILIDHVGFICGWSLGGFVTVYHLVEKLLDAELYDDIRGLYIFIEYGK
jgi:hypothetical protein